jgi:hypothetical protein
MAGSSDSKPQRGGPRREPVPVPEPVPPLVRGPGRPRKPAEEKVVHIEAYVSEDEREKVYALARAEGVSAAKWIANVIRREIKRVEAIRS